VPEYGSHSAAVALLAHGAPLDAEAADFVRRQPAKGGMGGLWLSVDDCHKTFMELSAKGVTFLQEPSDRPYGVVLTVCLSGLDLEVRRVHMPT
jgi:hypothetical protein